MHIASHLSRLTSLVGALATEISWVFSEPYSLGFPKVGGGRTICQGLQSSPWPVQLKVLFNHLAAEKQGQKKGPHHTLHFIPTLKEAEVASARGEVEAAEPKMTFRTFGLRDQLYHCLSVWSWQTCKPFWASASLFAKWRGLLPFFLCLLEKHTKEDGKTHKRRQKNTKLWFHRECIEIQAFQLLSLNIKNLSGGSEQL